MTMTVGRHRARTDPDRSLWAGEAATVAAVQALVHQNLDNLAESWRRLDLAQRRDLEELDTASVLELLAGMVDAGGKLFRPRMAYWGWVAGGGQHARVGHDELVLAGTALELLHVFALIHDDVMDASDTRRGRPSVHAAARAEHQRLGGLGDAQRYGENIAILAGDLAHSEAGLLVGRLPQSMQELWRTLTVELMVGQGRDLVGAANGRRDLEHARAVARAKSGAYTVTRPLQLGAIAAGAGSGTLSAVERYGTAAGEAFALRDDILGVIGDPQQTGKPVGDDLVAGKPTVLLALADARFGPRHRRLLQRAARGRASARQLADLQAELFRSGVIDDVEAMIATAVEAAIAALDDPAISPDAAAGLQELVRRMAWRDR